MLAPRRQPEFLRSVGTDSRHPVGQTFCVNQFARPGDALSDFKVRVTRVLLVETANRRLEPALVNKSRLTQIGRQRFGAWAGLGRLANPLIAPTRQAGGHGTHGAQVADVDIIMPDMSGIECARRQTGRAPKRATSRRAASRMADEAFGENPLRPGTGRGPERASYDVRIFTRLSLTPALSRWERGKGRCFGHKLKRLERTQRGESEWNVEHPLRADGCSLSLREGQGEGERTAPSYDVRIFTCLSLRLGQTEHSASPGVATRSKPLRAGTGRAPERAIGLGGARSQFCKHVGGRNTAELDNFVTGRAAANEFNVTVGTVEIVGKEAHDSVIGRGINRRRRHLDAQLAAQRFADFVCGSAGLDFDG